MVVIAMVHLLENKTSSLIEQILSALFGYMLTYTISIYSKMNTNDNERKDKKTCVSNFFYELIFFKRHIGIC